MCTGFQKLFFAKDTDSACLFDYGETVDMSGGGDLTHGMKIEWDQPMSDDESRSTSSGLIQRILHDTLGLRVQSACGLI